MEYGKASKKKKHLVFRENAQNKWEETKVSVYDNEKYTEKDSHTHKKKTIGLKRVMKSGWLKIKKKKIFALDKILDLLSGPNQMKPMTTWRQQNFPHSFF